MELKDENYIINVGPGGTFQKSGKYQTTPEQIDDIFETWENAGASNISLYFHGGLVSESEGLKIARKVAPHILKGDSFPICFIWETGLAETIISNITKLGETSFFQTVLKFLIEKVSKKVSMDIEPGRGNGQGIPKSVIEIELEKEVPFEEYDRWTGFQNSRGVSGLDALRNMDPLILEEEVQQEIQSEIEENYSLKKELEKYQVSVYNEKGAENGRGIIEGIQIAVQIGKIAYKIIRRFINRTDHGLYPTIVEEILRKFYFAELGAWVWKSMKDKSISMWNENNSRSDHQRFVGRYFLDKLLNYVTKNSDVKVNLIGHSAGSIAICNLLTKTIGWRDQLKFNRIIFLAPACRTDLFIQTVMSSQDRFKSLRVFTMSDENECKDACIPFIYTRSLLYLISGILEDNGESHDVPILGLERHISFNSPYNSDAYKEVHDYLYMKDENRICYSTSLDSAVEGMRTRARKHGDFDDNLETLTSVSYLLRNS